MLCSTDSGVETTRWLLWRRNASKQQHPQTEHQQHMCTIGAACTSNPAPTKPCKAAGQGATATANPCCITPSFRKRSNTLPTSNHHTTIMQQAIGMAIHILDTAAATSADKPNTTRSTPHAVLRVLLVLWGHVDAQKERVGDAEADRAVLDCLNSQEQPSGGRFCTQGLAASVAAAAQQPAAV
jgi:hypothetical protein